MSETPKKSKKAAPKKDVDLRTLPKDKRPKPTSGQSAPPFQLSFDELDKVEIKLIRVANGEGKGVRPVVNIAGFAKAIRQEKLHTRNSLRRLVPSNWLERVETTIDDEGNEVPCRGHYRITKSGRERLAAALD